METRRNACAGSGEFSVEKLYGGAVLIHHLVESCDFLRDAEPCAYQHTHTENPDSHRSAHRSTLVPFNLRFLAAAGSSPPGWVEKRVPQVARPAVWCKKVFGNLNFYA